MRDNCIATLLRHALALCNCCNLESKIIIMDYYIRKCLCCFGVKELLWRATNNTNYILLYLSWYPRVLFFIFLFHCSHNKNTLMLCLLASFLIMLIACSIIMFLKSRYFASLHVVFTWWRHQMETFPRYWPFVRGVHRSPVNSQHKGQWRGAWILSLICTWIDGWVKHSWGWWFETPSHR